MGGMEIKMGPGVILIMIALKRAVHLEGLTVMKGCGIVVGISSHAWGDQDGTSGISFIEHLRDIVVIGAMRLGRG
jgi:hypothetical protein